MKTVHIVGGKNHGKTTLLTDLIREMARRGFRVGAIKHTHHVHELDTPKTDSYRLRSSGASPSAIVAGNLMAVYIPLTGDDDGYQNLAGLYADCDLVLVEGDLARPGIKIEVWREAVGGPCLALRHRDIAAVVTDDPAMVSVPVWPRGNVARLADHILSLVATDEHLRTCRPPRNHPEDHTAECHQQGPSPKGPRARKRTPEGRDGRTSGALGVKDQTSCENSSTSP